MIGATLGSILAFLFARYFGREYLEGVIVNKSLQEKIDKQGFNLLLFLRLVPVFPYLVVNYVAGFSRISLKDYILATFLGMIPGVFVYTYLFATVGEQILEDGLSWSVLTDKNLILALGLFMVMIGVSVYFKNYYEKKI